MKWRVEQKIMGKWESNGKSAEFGTLHEAELVANWLWFANGPTRIVYHTIPTEAIYE